MVKALAWLATYLTASVLALLSLIALGLIIGELLFNWTYVVTQASAALAPDATYQFIQNSASNPGVVTIYSPTGQGSGYITSDGQIYTAYHVVDNGIRGIYFFGRGLSWGEGQCEVLNGDGPCAIQSWGSTAPIIRYPHLNLWQEVAIYHQDYQAWMFYQAVLVGDNSSYLVGLGMDANGDGKADFNSFGCSGMSGSPVFLSQNGTPYIYQGNYVSVGEFVAITYPWDRGDLKCSSNLIIVH